MIPFEKLTSVVAPLIRDNVDTDAIIPSREITSTGKVGLVDGLFAPWRYRDAEARIPDNEFILNQPQFADAQILASGDNFGCGSSREHAVWALAEFGIKCVVAESFAPIFYNNCIRNGLLPVVLGKGDIAGIAGLVVTVDLDAQTIAGLHFDIDAQIKTMLLEGVDTIDLTLRYKSDIARWQSEDRQRRPWIYLEKHA